MDGARVSGGQGRLGVRLKWAVFAPPLQISPPVIPDFCPVIPAKAGIHSSLCPRENGDCERRWDARERDTPARPGLAGGRGLTSRKRRRPARKAALNDTPTRATRCDCPVANPPSAVPAPAEFGNIRLASAQRTSGGFAVFRAEDAGEATRFQAPKPGGRKPAAASFFMGEG